MNRRSLGTISFGVVLAAISLIACIEEPLQPRLAHAGMDAGAPAPALDQPVTQSVTGQGYFAIEGVRRTSDFSIHKRADGTVDGWYHVSGPGRDGSEVRVRIEYLHVAGNQAWASGVVVAAADRANIGRPYTIRFVDNGTGPVEGPDRIGTAPFVGYDCLREPDIHTGSLMTGDLRIRS